jgi:hypothetical protein
LHLAGWPIICDIWLSYSPYTWQFPLEPLELITCILEVEYGSTVVQALFCEPMSWSDRCRIACREDKQVQVTLSAAQTAECCNLWPSLVPKQTILQCQDAYCKGSRWAQPPVCTVCAQCQDDCQIFSLSNDSSDFHVDSLHATNSYII